MTPSERRAIVNALPREWECFFNFVGWDCLSLGLHLCLRGPHIQVHLPFGFVGIGWHKPTLRECRAFRLDGVRERANRELAVALRGDREAGGATQAVCPTE